MPRSSTAPAPRTGAAIAEGNDLATRAFLSFHEPLASPAAVAREPDPFPRAKPEKPTEVWYDDWRHRLARNLARRSDGRWEPLTHLEGASDT